MRHLAFPVLGLRATRRFFPFFFFSFCAVNASRKKCQPSAQSASFFSPPPFLSSQASRRGHQFPSLFAKAVRTYRFLESLSFFFFCERDYPVSGSACAPPPFFLPAFPGDKAAGVVSLPSLHSFCQKSALSGAGPFFPPTPKKTFS